MEKVKEHSWYNSVVFGIIASLLGLVLGFFVVGFIWTSLNGVDISYWIDTVFLGVPIYRINVLTGSTLINIAAFFFLYPRGYHQLCKGILAVMIVLVLVMVILFVQ